MSLRFTPFTKKLMVSSRCPAVTKAKDPWPRRGAVKNPFAGGVTVPGVNRLRSTKCRPLSGISCVVFWSMTWPMVMVLESITGVSTATVTDWLTSPTCNWTFCVTVVAASKVMFFTTEV